MNTWLEQLKRECELGLKESSHLATLKRQVAEGRLARSAAYRNQLAYVESFVPIEQQIQQWWNGLSESLRCRSFSTMELVVQLRGRYKPRPASSAVATALRKLGFVQYRDW